MCHFFILEKAPFSGLKLTSVHSRCPLNVALFALVAIVCLCNYAEIGVFIFFCVN